MVADLSPLLHGAGGGEIRVAGVAVGERAAEVDRAMLTGAEEDEPGESRCYTNGAVYRITADGTQIEVPLGARIDATLRQGGFLRCHDVALRVNDGVVEQIFVRGPSLGTLGITREDAIATAFGPAEGHERTSGWRIHHYPTRWFAIAWDERTGRVEHVKLCAAAWQEPRLGAPALLTEVLRAFRGLASTGWAEPPEGAAKVRYRRIAALSSALGLGSPAALLRGEFLSREAVEPGHQPLLEELASRAPVNHPIREWSVGFLFSSLLHYRFDVERVVRATSGWLECSDPVLLGMIVTQGRIGTQLAALMTDIDRWLHTLMDPASRTFELRELIALHGWPDVDLDRLELDELEGMRTLPAVIAAAFSDADDRAELASIVGVRSEEALAAWIAGLCRARLGSDLIGGRFATKSVGAVFGLELANGTAVVLKLFHPRQDEGALRAVERCHGCIVEAGFPGPRQLAPLFQAEGVWGAFYQLVEGEQLDAHDPEVRDTLARALWDFARVAGAVDPTGLPLAPTRADTLWERPHKLDVDLSRPGGEWIDARAEAARAVIRQTTLPLLAAHLDWGTKNALFRAGRLHAMLDWDSLMQASEPEMVGRAAAQFTAQWDFPARLTPTPAEATAFVRAYQEARGRAFTPLEQRVVKASADYLVAQVARQEHGHPPKVDDFRSLLRETAAAPLVSFG